jgi:homoserine kinase
MPAALQSASVRVPCSTSNLGSGFDVLGLALNRYLEATFEPGGAGLELMRSGTLTELEEDTQNDFLALAFRRVMEANGVEPQGTIRATSEVPMARGLGSSAMASVAGNALARAALSLERSPDAAFRAAHDHEGHGDNAAPCAFGGLRAVVQVDGGARALKLSISRQVGFAYAAPTTRVGTAEARTVLPDQVPHATAVLGHGRFAALLQGLATADHELVRIGLLDELHVPHRLPLIPGADAAMEAGREAGAWGVTISGSGSGLIAPCPPERSESVAEAMRDAFATHTNDPDCWGMALEPDRVGLVVGSV